MLKKLLIALLLFATIEDVLYHITGSGYDRLWRKLRLSSSHALAPPVTVSNSTGKAVSTSRSNEWKRTLKECRKESAKFDDDTLRCLKGE